jgi:acyl carrier protein
MSTPVPPQPGGGAPADGPLEDRVRRCIVQRLRLKIDPATIGPDQPLFGDGLGLDSIDALELAVGLEKEFGVRFEDPDAAKQALRTVAGIAGYVRERSPTT